MKYGLEDLKSVSDECMQGFVVSAQKQNFIIQKCLTTSKRYSNKSRSLLLAASGMAACFAAVCLITLAVRPQSNIPASSVTPSVALASAESDDFVRVGSQSSNGNKTVNGYMLVQNENGLWGLKDSDGKWVVSPLYTKAYFENGVAYFSSETDSMVFPIPSSLDVN